MGTTENRLIIHQYSKPGAVPVGVVWKCCGTLSYVSLQPEFPIILNSWPKACWDMFLSSQTLEHFVHAKWSYSIFNFNSSTSGN